LHESPAYFKIGLVIAKPLLDWVFLVCNVLKGFKQYFGYLILFSANSAGSIFIFPLVLHQYELLFDGRLDLLLKARDHEYMTWSGKTLSSIDNLGIYPRTEKPLDISMALGRSRSSLIKAGKLGLPAVLAMLGENIAYFGHYATLYRQAAQESGHNRDTLKFSVQAHGFVLNDSKKTAKTFFRTYNFTETIYGQIADFPHIQSVILIRPVL
tara:strand:+ start:101 stop:733 length:633 start_codon:yes stop_codon:yes gene_type:complete